MTLRSMNWDTFLATRSGVDQQIITSTHVDAICSASAWGIAAMTGLDTTREPQIYQLNDSMLLFSRLKTKEHSHYLLPLECMWLFACPLVSTNMAKLMENFAQPLESLRAQGFSAMLVPGIWNDSPQLLPMLRNMQQHGKVYRGVQTERVRLNLELGWQTYLARRSGAFRRQLKRSANAAAKEYIRMEQSQPNTIREAQAAYQRLLAVENLSWKGGEATGLTTLEMRDFYAAMLPLLMADGALRLWFARRDGMDVGYVLGARYGAGFRALQFSFHNHWQKLGLGRVMLAQALEQETQAGAHWADLGSVMDYKLSWGDFLWSSHAWTLSF